jgi:hypothetical protein
VNGNDTDSVEPSPKFMLIESYVPVTVTVKSTVNELIPDNGSTAEKLIFGGMHTIFNEEVTEMSFIK